MDNLSHNLDKDQYHLKKEKKEEEFLTFVFSIRQEKIPFPLILDFRIRRCPESTQHNSGVDDPGRPRDSWRREKCLD
jgi:hypothetical protein